MARAVSSKGAFVEHGILLVAVACFLLGCASTSTSASASASTSTSTSTSTKTTRDGEYRVAGHVFRIETHCHTPPLPARPYTGSLRVYLGGELGHSVTGEPLRTVNADEKAGYEVYLPPGGYCLSASEGICDVAIVVPDSANLEKMNVYSHVRANPQPCKY